MSTVMEQDKGGAEGDQIESTVEHLKQWLKNQEHMPPITNDKLLYHIAAATKGNNVTACKKLDSYFTVRSLIPEYFSHRDPLAEDIRQNCRSMCLNFLPGITSDGSKVLMFTIMDNDLSLFDLAAAMRRFYMFLDLAFLKDDLKPGQGVYIANDYRYSTLSLMLKLSPTLLRKATFCLQDVYPIRVKGIVCVNVNDVIRMTVNTIILPLFKQKLRKRFQIFGTNYDKLYNLIPKEILPSELGGDGPTYRELCGEAELISQRNWFLTEGSDKTDESKRIEKCPISPPNCSIM